MGKDNLAGYFWFQRNKELSPLRVGHEHVPESELYRMIIFDRNGVRIVDGEELDMESLEIKTRHLAQVLEERAYQFENIGLISENT